MRALVFYSFGRVGIFIIIAALGYLAGLRDLPLVLVAIVISLPLSYLALRPQRNALSAVVQKRVEDRQRHREEIRSQLHGDD